MREKIQTGIRFEPEMLDKISFIAKRNRRSFNAQMAVSYTHLGHKGQKARSGGSIRPGFEGGQMPLQRRVPKRGFVNIFRTQYTNVNVGDLDAKFEDGATVDTEALVAAGLVKKVVDGVKVLGDGETTKNLIVKAAAFSKSAKEKIEKAGGKAEVV